MKTLITHIILLIPFISFSQFDAMEWERTIYDSLFKLHKPTIQLTLGNNGYVSDIPNVTKVSFPGHITGGIGLVYSQPLKGLLNLDINGSYNKIGANSYSSAENFQGSYIGGDLGVSFNFFRESRLTPFLALGIGGGIFNTSKDSLSENGSTYYHWSDGTTRDLPDTYENGFIANEINYDNNYETTINKGASYYVPLSAGAKFKITPKLYSSLSYTYNVVSDIHDGANNGLDGIHQVKFGIGFRLGVKKPLPPVEDSIIIDIIVLDSITKQPLAEANIWLYMVSDSGKVLIDSAVTDVNGHAPLYYPETPNIYVLDFDKDEYFSRTVDLPEHNKDKKAYTENNPKLEVELGTTWRDIPVSGNVIDRFTENSLDSVKVTLWENIDGVWTAVKEVYSDENGDFAFSLDHEGDYKVSLEKDQYQNKEFEVPDINNEEDWSAFMNKMNPFTMEPEIKKGNVFKVDNIYFAFAKSEPLKESFPILDNIVNFMNENPKVRIELGAHTDCVGRDKDNLRLSNARAKSAVDYLVNNGIDKSRLESKGYGETQILNGCYNEGDCSKEKNQVNRRVEVKVL